MGLLDFNSGGLHRAQINVPDTSERTSSTKSLKQWDCAFAADDMVQLLW